MHGPGGENLVRGDGRAILGPVDVGSEQRAQSVDSLAAVRGVEGLVDVRRRRGLGSWGRARAVGLRLRWRRRAQRETGAGGAGGCPRRRGPSPIRRGGELAILRPLTLAPSCGRRARQALTAGLRASATTTGCAAGGAASTTRDFACSSRSSCPSAEATSRAPCKPLPATETAPTRLDQRQNKI